MEKSRYLSTRDTAHYVGVSPSFLAKMRCAGGGPTYIKVGRGVLYDRQDLDDWLASQKRRSTSEARSGCSAARRTS